MITTKGSLYGSRQGREEYPSDNIIQIHISTSLDLMVSNEEARALSEISERQMQSVIEEAVRRFIVSIMEEKE